MRYGHLGLAALTLTMACVRLGYDPQRITADPDPDASARDAQASNQADAAIADAGARPDAAIHDASLADAAMMDGTIPALDSSAATSDAETGEPGDHRERDAEADAAASDAGAPVCADHPEALFCDGFEDPELAPWTYTVVMNGSVERTTDQKRSGDASLRARTGSVSSSSHAARYGRRVFDHQKSGDIWLRYYYYLPGSVTVSTNFSTVVVAELEPPYMGFSLLVRSSHVAIASGNSSYEGTIAFPRDKWTCVELHVKIDTPRGVFEAYIDGTLAVSSPETDTKPAKGYTAVDVGIHYTDPAQGPVEAYVDDVVAANSPVGCE